MTPEQSPRRFTNEEVDAILKRALARQGGGSTGALTYEDLLETAKELGIDPSQVQAAMLEQEQEGPLEAARVAWKAGRKKKFFEHLRTYLIINAILIAIALVSESGGWPLWPLLGWGIAILFDASDTFFPKEKAIDRGARRLMERERRTQHKEVKVETRRGTKSLTIDGKAGKIIIEKGDKRIEIG